MADVAAGARYYTAESHALQSHGTDIITHEPKHQLGLTEAAIHSSSHNRKTLFKPGIGEEPCSLSPSSAAGQRPAVPGRCWPSRGQQRPACEQRPLLWLCCYRLCCYRLSAVLLAAEESLQRLTTPPPPSRRRPDQPPWQCAEREGRPQQAAESHRMAPRSGGGRDRQRPHVRPEVSIPVRPPLDVCPEQACPQLPSVRVCASLS